MRRTAELLSEAHRSSRPRSSSRSERGRKRARRPFRRGRRGVAGFFEELPIMLMATLAFLLTLAAVLNGFRILQQDQNEATLRSDAQGLADDLLTYSNLTYFGESGVFVASEVVNLSATNLTWSFNPGFAFQVSIQDFASEGPHYDRTVGTGVPPTTSLGLQAGIYTASVPVVLRVSDLVTHPGNVEVSVWS